MHGTHTYTLTYIDTQNATEKASQRTKTVWGLYLPFSGIGQSKEVNFSSKNLLLAAVIILVNISARLFFSYLLSNPDDLKINCLPAPLVVN